MNTITAWLLSLMVQVAPPSKLAAAPQWPGWEETEVQKLDRYKDIANDLYQVAYDPSVRPLYGGQNGRAMTAATILAIAFHESGFARDVDTGPCYKGRSGRAGRCDGGLAACMMQVRLGAGWTTLRAHGIEGLTQNQLFEDRQACFRVGLHIVRRSFSACAKFGPDAKLNAYASGTCTRGQKAGKESLDIARRFVADKDSIPGPDLAFLVSPKKEAVSFLSAQ